MCLHRGHCQWLVPPPRVPSQSDHVSRALSFVGGCGSLESGAATSRSLRNCSCSAPVTDCDEVLANSLCRCHSVPRSALPRAGLREAGQLAVWVKELWVLEELLNGSSVGHLRLSFCGIKPVDSRYLALRGLQTLGIHSAVPQTPYPDQEMTLSPPAGVTAELDTLSFGSSSFLHMTFVDVAVLNGLSALKAYSVAGPFSEFTEIKAFKKTPN
uniref:Uncharacterized protein n=1 Tax=Pundamilia nyererei TaxID=303518 RepID=A0A3B4FHM9_9CICH